MNSKKEEERNEKIIRGLMKLPPNRRCINCNSLGPQYVCTNFWTFICTTCSGIHREFTHRVKSVSMAKFTSQEVEALQEGGNQRARETFLKDWDPQRQKQPNNSDAEKVREFIKHVYVDRKYARGKISDKPPRDAQNLRHPGEETRRASSYHSYSQSPPYDYQYEERQYRRQLPALTRKPGSDRGCYDGKVPNFSSLSSFSDQTFEDRFANEGSNPRASDYSVSSPGDPFRSDNRSPNFQQDVKCTSPPYQTADTVNQKVQNQITNSFLESNIKENAERPRRTQRATSSGSFGSFDSTSMSLQSVSSVTSADLVSGSGPEQPVEIHQDKQYADSSLPQRSTSSNFGGLDLFNTPAPLHTVTPSLTVDLFQLPGAQPRPPIDLFEPSSTLSAPELNGQLSSKTIPSSLDFSQLPQPLPPVTLDKGSPNEVISKNEGWATFDFPQHIAPNQGVVHSVPLGVASNGGYLEKVDQLLLPSTGTQWPAFEGISAHEPSSVHNLWHGELYQSHASVTNTQHSWDAFEDPTRRHPYSGRHQGGDKVAGQAPSTTMDQPLSEFNKEGFQRMVFNSRPPIPRVPIRVEAQAHAIDRKSSNPFDISDDSDFECSSTFPNMASLQAALPSGLLPDSMVNDVTQSWLSHNPFPHYIPAAQQGALGFMGGQALSTQMPTVPAQEPVASVGGNPFA